MQPEQSNTECDRYRGLIDELQRRRGPDPYGQLVGQIAHDFNNLLAISLTGSEMAQSLVEDPRARRFLEKSIDALRRGRTLTECLGDFSHSQFDEAVIDVHELIDSMRARMRETIGEACVLELSLAAECSIVRSDARMLAVALSNIVDNAAEALGGPGHVRLMTCNHDRNGFGGGKMMEITVADDGCGPTDDSISRGFDLFFTTKPGHRGLGLSQVRDAARRSGGMVTIDGAEGAGTVVRLSLPLAGLA